MIDINKLSDQVKKMIDLEKKLNETDWKNEDDIYEYNILQDEILDYLKECFKD